MCSSDLANNRLFDYYAKFGFETVFFNAKNEIQICDAKTDNYSISEYKNEDIKSIYQFFNNQMQKRNFCVQHDFDDLEIVIEDLYASNGQLFIIRDIANQEISALVFAEIENDKLFVKELLIYNSLSKDTVYSLIKTKLSTPVTLVTELIPAQKNSKNKLPLGMIRIINVYSLLCKFALCNKNISFSIEVEDKLIDNNNGKFKVDNGICSKIINNDTNHNFIKMTIHELSNYLFGLDNKLKTNTETYPYMSLMLN